MREFLIAPSVEGPLRKMATAFRSVGINHYADWIDYCLNGWKEAEDRVFNIEAFLFERGLMYDWACWKHGAPNDRNRRPEDPPQDQSTGGRTGSDGGAVPEG